MATRRVFLQSTLLTPFASSLWAEEHSNPLAREVGVTTGSFMKHLAKQPERGKLVLLDLPRIMRDELGMKVLDLMTATLASFEPKYLDQLRNAAEKHGCVITNLKMNLKGFDYDDPDAAVRAKALTEYKSKIDAAARLGARWVRPAPGTRRPDMAIHVASLREMIAHAKSQKLHVLIENNGWMSSDADAIPNVVKAVGPDLGVSPDTGNWKSEVRAAGLAKAFPLASTCDFKVMAKSPDGCHPYDVKECFEIGWKSGFRGPWCIEHFGDTLGVLLKGMVEIRDNLKKWMG